MSGFSESTAPQGARISRKWSDGGLLEHRDSEVGVHSEDAARGEGCHGNGQRTVG